MRLVNCIVCGVEFAFVARGPRLRICSRACHDERKRNYARVYYQEHHGKTVEYQRLYRAASRETARDIERRWRNANPEKVREYHRRYRETNHDRVIESSRLDQAKTLAALEVFRHLIGPCRFEERRVAKRILQQLGETQHVNATS